MQAVKRKQLEVEVIPEDSEGDIDIAALEQAVAAGTCKPALIAITHIPTSSGKNHHNSAAEPHMPKVLEHCILHIDCQETIISVAVCCFPESVHFSNSVKTISYWPKTELPISLSCCETLLFSLFLLTEATWQAFA